MKMTTYEGRRDGGVQDEVRRLVVLGGASVFATEVIRRILSKKTSTEPNSTTLANNIAHQVDPTDVEVFTNFTLNPTEVQKQFIPGSQTEVSQSLSELFLFYTDEGFGANSYQRSYSLIDLIDREYNGGEKSNLGPLFEGYLEEYMVAQENTWGWDFHTQFALQNALEDLLDQNPQLAGRISADYPRIIKALDGGGYLLERLDDTDIIEHLEEGGEERVKHRIALYTALLKAYEGKTGFPKCKSFPGRDGDRLAIISEVFVNGRKRIAAFIFNADFPERSTILSFRNEEKLKKMFNRTKNGPELPSCPGQAINTLREIVRLIQDMTGGGGNPPAATG